MRANEAGFTLVELLIGAAIGVFVLWGLIALAGRLAFSAASLNARLNGQTAADRLVERLSSEAASAWAVWAPSPNEIDFFSEDGSHRTFTWSYVYDPLHQTVTRSTGEVLGNFTTFDAEPATISADPLLAGSTVPSVPFPFESPSGAVGGNALVSLHIGGPGFDRTDYFASGTAPTAFTVMVQYTPSPTPLVTPTPIPLR